MYFININTKIFQHFQNICRSILTIVYNSSSEPRKNSINKFQTKWQMEIYLKISLAEEK